MNSFRLLPFTLLAGLLACQKPIDSITPPVTPPREGGVVYDMGTPTGQAIQKSIGPQGGTLTSADGALQMTIPAGAVSQATTFSMQPVTPTLPGLIGKQAYRLLPEGLTFAKPVTLQFHYGQEDLAGNSAQLLFMAYQSMDGIWKALPHTELDEASRTLTVTTTHFSDWGAFAEFELEAEHDFVKPGESCKLTLVGYPDMLEPLGDNEVKLSKQQTLSNPNNIKNWRVIGKGSIRPDASHIRATYAAPSDAVGGTTLISVDVYNFLPPNRQPRKGAGGKAVILKPLRITGNVFEATLDDIPFSCEAAGFIDERGTTITADITLPGGLPTPFDLLIRKKTLEASTTYPYKIEALGLDGGVGALLSDGQKAWVAYYAPCDGDDIVNSPGGVRIDKIDGHTVSGSLTVTLYKQERCKVTHRKLSAKFTVELTQE